MQERSPLDHWIGSVLAQYHIHQVVEQTELGLLLVAWHEADQSDYLVRVLNVPPAQSSDMVGAYQTQMERQASHLATLTHPAILPLLDFGVDRGLPYLVWPRLAMRPLSVRLAQSGPVDVVTVGRYLDQAAGALEFAYEHATIHRNLSVDCVFLQMDGHILVSDFGVRRLVELLRQSGSSQAFYGSLEACAPEQILGQRVGTYTDVYALGALTYRLLTGQPVFTGGSLDEILRHHLHSWPPSLATWRDDLPSGLDGVLAGALAKDPEHRFPHPGTFANAYHQIVAPNSKMRVPVAIGVPPSSQSLPTAMDELLASDRRNQTGSPSPAGGEWGVAQHSLEAPASPVRNTLPTTMPDQDDGSFDSSHHSHPRGARGNIGRIAVAVALIGILVGGGFFVFNGFSSAAQGHPTGMVLFMDRSNSQAGFTDALRITTHDLAPAPSGSHYYAWFIDQASEHILPLGMLVATNRGYGLEYPQAGDTSASTANLLAIGDKIEITLEDGVVKAPTGRVVLMATFPPQAYVHVRHLLLSFPITPNKIGLLVGVLTQTQIVDTLASTLKSLAAGGSVQAIQCDAQGIVDAIEGMQGQHYRPLGDACTAFNITSAGDGFGLLGAGSSAQSPGYLDGAIDHASLAATQPDATNTIRLYAGQVQSAITTIKGQITRADAVALTLLGTPTNVAAMTQLLKLCDLAYHGQQAGGNSTSGTAQSEAGAVTAYAYGQSMATLALTTGN